MPATDTNTLNHLTKNGQWAFIAFALDANLNEVAIYSDRRSSGIPREVWVDTVPTFNGMWKYVYPGREDVKLLNTEQNHE